jgi:ABC-2 type transport system permease protein
MLLGSIGLRAKDVFFAANLAYFLMLLFCGVNIPLRELPGWMQLVGNLLPFTHGLQAVREAADGAGFSQVGGLIGIEALVGIVYALVAFTLFVYLERSARRNATLDVR